jgi:hypothetical protein
MNRPATALFAALESLLVVGIGVGIPVVSLTFLWAFQYGLQIDWLVFWRVGVDVWLVGHGVDLSLVLSPSAAAATGIAGAGAPILLSIAALGFAVTTVLLGVRSGRRLAETRHRALGTATAIGVFAVLAALLTFSARQPLAEPSVVQGIVWPTLFFAVPLLAAAEVTRRRRGAEADPVTAAVLRGLELIPQLGREVTLASLRLGTAVAMAVFAVAGLAVALLLLTHYASIITLYEGAHAGLLGGLALTLGQIALIPNAVAWAASWFVGPGFALGAGSSVSPLGTVTGPMPAIPFLGALPTSDLAFGFVGVLVPVLAAFVGATLLRPALERLLGDDDSLLTRIVTGVGAGVVAGVLLGGVAALSSGSAGPGRLAQVGPNGFVVGAFAALEVALPAVLALVVRQPEWSLGGRLPAVVTDRIPGSRGASQAASAGSKASASADPKGPAANDARAQDLRETDVLPRLGDSPLPPDQTVTERLDDLTR